MVKKRIGIITLAITFILVGIFFLIEQFINFDIRFVLSILWPIIIILLGLEILFTKLIADNSKKEIKYVYSKSSIVFIIIAVLVISALSNFDSVFSINDTIGFFSDMYKYHSEYNREFNIQLSDQELVELYNNHGKINVRKGDVKDLKVTASISIDNNDEEYTNAFVDRLIQINEDNDYILIKTSIDNYDRRLIKNLEVNYNIILPRDIQLNVENSYGEIRVKDNNKKIELKNRHGDVIVSNVKSIDVKNSYGDIEISNISDDVKLSNRHGKITVNNVKGKVNVSNEYGEIKLEELQDVNVTSLHESVYVSNIKGSLKIDSKYAEITVARVDKDVEINTNNEDVKIEDVNGSCKITNKHGDITAVNLKKAVDIDNSNGLIDIRFDDINHSLVRINNKHGNVDFSINENQGGQLLFYTNRNIVDFLNETELNVQREDNKQIVNKTINDDKAKFDIKVINGDINIIKP
ncbi:DUF4097 family beta strand repeat-containing protein [Abyssisolibacter fermentans]|uniref:DUF4097 family beta strand repeat-containing protein n=1 Tax=Abyssisolibacter fermentans TaxID=1766203 RepID=UPI0008375284|nr:DUF4097 family beta strand repeat-containing protein [Abyssisolibacter fermentans]